MTTPSDERVRWAELASQRESLLRLARARTDDPADAEDAVSEALLRAAQRPQLSGEHLGPWLNVVTQNLCRRQARDRARFDRHARRRPLQDEPPPPDERVCDQSHAESVARLTARLPERQRQALELRAAGLDVAAIAARLDLSYAAVESLLSRARRAMRTLVKATLVWVLGIVAALKRTGAGRSATGAAMTVGAVAVVLGILHGGLPGERTATTPARKPVQQQARIAATPAEQPALRPPPLRRVAPRRASAPATRTSDTASAGEAAPALPALRVPARRVEVPAPGGMVFVQGERQDEDESFAETLARCVQAGPAVSLERIGCPPQSRTTR